MRVTALNMVILQLEEQPPIIQAIFAGVVDEVKELIEYKQDINFLDCEKRTPLHAAAFKGDAAISSLLLHNGARVNAKDSKWVTPLHRGCSVGADETVSLLLNYQADVCARDRLWQTPLHVAAANDAYSCVEQLLNHVPNPNVTDRSGRTALHHASYNGHTYVAELLISKGCIVNACDKKDCRPLHCAVQMGHIDTVELLLKNNADINAKDRNQYTPLHVAAASGIETVCRLLLNAGAEVDAQNVYGNTPLHIACLNGHLNICQDLVHVGANLEATNFRGQTPLHIAAASTHGVDCLMFLLRQNVDINKQSLDGRTPLHMTAIHGRFTRSKTLIDKGALIDCADKNGCTALHIAAQYGHDLLANTLLSYGANASKKGYEGRTPLHMCCLSGYVECGRKFVQAGVDLNDKDDTGKTPTHCAAYKGSYECLDLLVSNGADFKLLDHLQRLPIHYAASQGHYQCVFTLVGIGSPVNAQDVEGCSALHLAAAYDHEGKCVEYLLDHKADHLTKDNRCFTPLHYAIAGGNVNGVRILLTKGYKISDQIKDNNDKKKFVEKDSVDVTPFHLAAKLGNLDILRMVMPHCIDVNIKTNQGLTPLILAAREGHSQCVHFLLRFGAKVALADGINNMTPVHYSAKNGHSKCLTLLLHNSEDQEVVNMLDREHRTALMLAVSGNHIECVQALLKCGADPNIVDTDNHSCLFRAVVNGQNSVVQLLLSSNAEVQATDVNGKTVLHLAAACGHFVCMQMILAYMTEEVAGAKDNQQCTALHWACYNGHANCVEYLLEKNIFKELEGNSFSPVHCATFSGSEKCLELLVNHFGAQIIHLTDCRQRTPLHIAALHGHTECAKYLIEQGSELKVIDDEGRTPFVAAAQYGQSQIVELLLTYNIDRSSCDKLGNTALHWACLKKHSQTALLLLEDTQGDVVISMTNNDKKTPLHISARNGLVDVTRELLKKGASVLAVDNEGLTPALCCAPNSSVAQCLALILQSLPQFADPNALANDVLNLTPFCQELAKSKICEQKSAQAQTMVSLSFLADDFEIHSKFQPTKCVPPLRKTSTIVNLQETLEKNDDCFLLQNKDFYDDYYQKPPPEKTGLNLHKSYSDISIASSLETKKPQPVNKMKQCRECFRLQHRCPECTMRFVLRKHLLGRTTQKEFNEFITKCVSEPSTEYRRLFNCALESVGKELGMSDRNRKLEAAAGKSTTSLDYQLMVLNKNRALIGGIRKQNIDILNKPGKVHKKKQSTERTDKQITTVAFARDKECVKRSSLEKQGSKREKIMPQLQFEMANMFVIDKDDPVLKCILMMEENEEHKVNLKEKACVAYARESKCNQTSCVKNTKKLSQFHLDTTFCEGSMEIRPRNLLTVVNLEPVNIVCHENRPNEDDTTTETSVIDDNASDDEAEGLDTEDNRNLRDEYGFLKEFDELCVILAEKKKIYEEKKRLLLLNARQCSSSNEKVDDAPINAVENVVLNPNEQFLNIHSGENSGVDISAEPAEKPDAGSVMEVKKKKNSGMPQSSISSKDISLALKMTMSNISNLNDMKSGSNHSSDNEFY